MCSRSVCLEKDCCTRRFSIPVVLNDFVNFRERLATFTGKWPKFLPGPSIRDIARAGFVYHGFSDRAKCFSCGVVLREWENGDDVFKEHIRWAPSCRFARMLEAEAPDSLRRDTQENLSERGYDYPG